MSHCPGGGTYPTFSTVLVAAAALHCAHSGFFVARLCASSSNGDVMCAGRVDPLPGHLAAYCYKQRTFRGLCAGEPCKNG